MRKCFDEARGEMSAVKTHQLPKQPIEAAEIPLARAPVARSSVGFAGLALLSLLCLTLFAPLNAFATPQWEDGDLTATIGSQTRAMTDLVVASSARTTNQGQDLTVHVLGAKNTHLFATAPSGVFELSGESTARGDMAQNVVLRGGIAAVGVSGEWTATVWLSDRSEARQVGEVRIEVQLAATPVNGPPTFEIGQLSTQVEVGAQLVAFEVLRNVQDPDGDSIEVRLNNMSGMSVLASDPEVVVSPVPDRSSSYVLVANLSGEFGRWMANLIISDGSSDIEVGNVVIDVVGQGRVISNVSTTMRVAVRAAVRFPLLSDVASLTGSPLLTDVESLTGNPPQTRLLFSNIEGAPVFSTTPTAEYNIVADDVVLVGRLSGEIGHWQATVMVDDGTTAEPLFETILRVLPHTAVPMMPVEIATQTCPTPTQTVTGSLLRVCEVALSTPEAAAVTPEWVVAVNARNGDAAVDNTQVLLMNAASTAFSSDGTFTPINLFEATPAGMLRLNDDGRYDIVLNARIQQDAYGEWTATVVLRDADGDEAFGEVTLRVETNTPPAYSPFSLTTSFDVDEARASGEVLAPMTIAENLFPGDAPGARVTHPERSQSLTVVLRDEAVSGGNIVQFGALFEVLPTVRLVPSITPADGGAPLAFEAVLDGGVLWPQAYGEWTATLELVDDGVPTHTVTVGAITMNVNAVNTAPLIHLDGGVETITTAPIDDSDPNSEEVVHSFNSLYHFDALSGGGLRAGSDTELDRMTLQYRYAAEDGAGRVRPTVLLHFGAQFANGDARQEVSVSAVSDHTTWRNLITITANAQARSEPVQIFAKANVDRGGSALLHLRLRDEHGLLSEPRALAIPVVPVNDTPTFELVSRSTETVLTLMVTRNGNIVRIVTPEDTEWRGRVTLAENLGVGVNDLPQSQALRARLEERSNNLFSRAPQLTVRNNALELNFYEAIASAPVIGVRRFVGVAYLSDTGIDLGSHGRADAIEVEVVTVSIEVAPANDAPTFVGGNLSITVGEDSGAVPALVVATDLADEDGDAFLMALLTDAASVIGDGDNLFMRAPTVQVRPAEMVNGVALSQSIELSNGYLAADANGVWTATVWLSDGTEQIMVGVVTIEVTPAYDAPTLNLGATPVALVGGRAMSSEGVVLARVNARDDTRTPLVRFNGGAALAQAPIAVYPFVASTPARIGVESAANEHQIVLRDGFVARGAPGETVAALEVVFAPEPENDLAALTLATGIKFVVSAPANAPVALALPDGTVSVKATGVGTHVPSSVTCAPEACALHAYYADTQVCGRFDTRPHTPSEIAAQCVSVRRSDDGMLELGSGHSRVWWVAVRDDGFQIAASVVDYYVAPFLGFGADLEVPAGGGAYRVTLAAQGYPDLALMTSDSTQLTVFSSTGGERTPHVLDTSDYLSFVWAGSMPSTAATLILSLGEPSTDNQGIFGPSGAFTRGREELLIVTATGVDADETGVDADDLSIGLTVTDACGAPLASVPARDQFACISESALGAAELRINARAWQVPTNLDMTVFVNAVSRADGRDVSRSFNRAQLLRTVLTPTINGAYVEATVDLVGYDGLVLRDELLSLNVSVTTNSGDALTRRFPLGDYPIDADGDGSVDTTMHMDEDGDGVPDADELSAAPTRLRAGEDVLVVSPGQRIELGVYSGAGGRAAHAGRAGARIDDDQTLPDNLRAGPVDSDGIYDFIVRLPLGERVARVVVPLDSPIPRGARYWKYRRYGVPFSDSDLGFWSRFVLSGSDTVFSAPRPCPAPHSSGWTPVLFDGTLTEGHECLLLLILDGGENDDDERRNYAVTDPGAVGTRLPAADAGEGTRVEPPVSPPPPPAPSSGGSGALDFVALFVLAILFILSVLLRRVEASSFSSPVASRHLRTGFTRRDGFFGRIAIRYKNVSIREASGIRKERHLTR